MARQSIVAMYLTSKQIVLSRLNFLTSIYKSLDQYIDTEKDLMEQL